MDIMAVSLPAGRPLGQLTTLPSSLFAHMASMSGFFAYSSGRLSVSQLRHGIVGHAVAYHQHVFHRFSLFLTFILLMI
jgi:hypothetical protein